MQYGNIQLPSDLGTRVLLRPFDGSMQPLDALKYHSYLYRPFLSRAARDPQPPSGDNRRSQLCHHFSWNLDGIDEIQDQAEFIVSEFVLLFG
jgi:hypothetical protein